MLGPQAILSTVMVAFVALAGCASSSSGTPAEASVAPASPPQYDDSTGAVVGVVTDDEAVPVAGAEVGIAGEGHTQTTTTDAMGAFTLSRIPPGGYQLFAQRLGFESTARRVDVAGGEVTEVRVILVALAVQEGHHDSWMKKGYFDCSWRIVPPAVVSGVVGPCGYFPVVGNVTQISSNFDNHRRAFVYDVGPGVVSVFNDVTWAKGSLATGDKLSVTFSYEKRSSSHWYCDDVGLNPIQMHWERAEDVEDNKAEGDCLSGGQNTPSAEPQTIPYTKGQQLRSFLNTGPAQNLATGGDFGTFALAWHQDFDIWFSVFYWERAPEGYSALPDA